MTNMEKLNQSWNSNYTAEITAVRMTLQLFADDYDIEGLCESNIDRFVRQYQMRKAWLESEVEE